MKPITTKEPTDDCRNAFDVEINNLLHRMNLDRSDIASLPDGATISINITTHRQAADLIKRMQAAWNRHTPQADATLIEKLEAKWKPSGIGVGSPLVRLDDVITIIRQHQSAKAAKPSGDIVRILELALYECRACVGKMPHTPILTNTIERIEQAITLMGEPSNRKAEETITSSSLATNPDHIREVTEMVWRPIETAPQNGYVLVYEPNVSDDTQIFLATRDPHVGGGWAIAYDGQGLSPTHWMPIPLPPADEKQGDK